MYHSFSIFFQYMGKGQTEKDEEKHTNQILFDKSILANYTVYTCELQLSKHKLWHTPLLKVPVKVI